MTSQEVSKTEISAKIEDLTKNSAIIDDHTKGLMAPGGGFEPPRPRKATSLQVHLKSESPGLLPAWLGDPGNFEPSAKNGLHLFSELGTI